MLLGYCVPAVRCAASHGSYSSTRPVEQMAERPLRRARHPQIERARIEVRAESTRVRARRAAPDSIRIDRVASRIEPLRAVRFTDPLLVEKPLHVRHLIALAGLHLGARPVDGIDLRLGANAAEEIVAGPAVVLEEPVPLDVVDDALIPVEGLLTRELATNDDTSATTQQREIVGRHGAGGDIRVVDHRPHLTAFCCGRRDLLDLGAHARLDHGEHLADRPTGTFDPRPQRFLRLRRWRRTGRPAWSPSAVVPATCRWRSVRDGARPLSFGKDVSLDSPYAGDRAPTQRIAACGSGLHGLRQRPLRSTCGQVPDGARAPHLCGCVALGLVGAGDRERDPRAMTGAVGEFDTDVLAGSAGRRDIERQHAIQVRPRSSCR